MQMIGRAIMNDLDFVIGQKILELAVSFWNPQLRGLGFGQFLARFAEGDHFDKSETAHRLDVSRADESSADNSCFNCFHGSFLFECRHFDPASGAGGFDGGFQNGHAFRAGQKVGRNGFVGGDGVD